MSSREAPRSLAEVITVGVDYQRSVSIENPDSLGRVVSGYIPTERALDMLTRLVSAADSRPMLRSWSVTGPYGSGKSSFVALAGALLGRRDSGLFREAMNRLAVSAPMLCKEVDAARSRARVGDRGYICALATARPEPATRLVSRALLAGAEEFWSGRGRKPHLLSRLRELSGLARPGVEDVLRVFAELEAHAPVLLALDEFGKILEFSAESPTEADLYVLQLLAERVNCSTSSASCIVTLQHLAMVDYAQVIDAAHRKEWVKIQGRFQEVAFANSPEQAVAFIRGHLAFRSKSPEMARRIAAWGSMAREMSDGVLSSMLGAVVSDVESTYPLHPLAVVLAPAISQRFGQSDRSLHTWLAGDEPDTLAEFLAATEFSSRSVLPVYGTDLLFDYFLGRPQAQAQQAVHDTRLTEVLSRVTDSRGRSTLDSYLVKTIGLLNLVGPMVSIASSRDLLVFAARLAGFEVPEIDAALGSLEEDGFIVYREHAKEYRLWQGSDVDIEECVRLAHERLAGLDLMAELNRVSPAEVRVAQRHGHKFGTFRYFKTVYADLAAFDDNETALADEADGLLLLSLSAPSEGARPTTRLADGRPVVVCQSPDRKAVQRALVDVVALREAAADDRVKADPVARKELRERLSEASDILSRAVREAFDPARTDLAWFALDRAVDLRDLKQLSSLLSDICDSAYSAAIPLHNEILNRVQLTSQGAKARRELLAHMLETPSLSALGIQGFGPERSMYESFFVEMGLHRESEGGAWGLGAPEPDAGIFPAWSEVDNFVQSTIPRRRNLDEVYRLLMLPPFGVRESVLPVLLLAYLAVHADDVALYQDGTFEPELSVPVMERMIKAPERFSVRRIGGGGLREVAASLLRERFARPQEPVLVARNASLLEAIRPIFGIVRRLNEYALYTTRVSEEARRIRAAITSANELDELLFVDLPEALGLEPLGVEREPDEAAALLFVARLVEKLEELSGAYDAMLLETEERMRALFNVRPGAEVRANLRERARRLQDQVIDRRLGTFIAYAIDERLRDRAWLEAVCMSLADKPAGVWRDSDREVFDVRLRELAGLFARVEHLCSAVDSDSAAQGFVARRVSITRPDGSEESKVVWADEQDLVALRSEVTKLKKRLRDSGGHERVEAFLAVLAEDVLRKTNPVATAAGDEGIQDDVERRRA